MPETKTAKEKQKQKKQESGEVRGELPLTGGRTFIFRKVFPGLFNLLHLYNWLVQFAHKMEIVQLYNRKLTIVTAKCIMFLIIIKKETDEICLCVRSVSAAVSLT